MRITHVKHQFSFILPLGRKCKLPLLSGWAGSLISFSLDSTFFNLLNIFLYACFSTFLIIPLIKNCALFLFTYHWFFFSFWHTSDYRLILYLCYIYFSWICLYVHKMYDCNWVTKIGTLRSKAWIIFKIMIPLLVIW